MSSRTMELRIVPVIQFVTIVAALKLGAVSCVPMKYEIGGYRNSVDLDAEQTEARYDQGMLSDIMNDERPPSELQKAESCVADNFKYDHGQKIQRYDPCEICLCIDGEIFCWWKQCDVPAQPMLDDDGDDDRPLGAIGDVQLAATSSSQLTTYNASTTTTTPSVDPSKPSAGELTNVATASPQPVTSAAAAAALSYPDQPDPSQQQQQQLNVRTVQHPPQSTPENIPQNILSFPQSPPIMMMYRPGLLGGKNASSSGASTTSERNKHGGPLKKVKPLHLAANGAGVGGGKKSYRKSKGGKGYVINYGRIEGGLEDGGGRTRVLAVTERIPQLSADGMRVLNDGERGFVPAVGGFGAGRRHDDENGSDDDDGDDDEDDDGDEDDEDDDESNEAVGQRSNVNAGANSDEGFGGYGFGMIKEPEDDKQQHYIITSSGHVEMFDDNSMEATENAFGMNRLPSQQSQLGSTSTTTIPPMALVLGGTLDDSPNQSATSSSVRRHDNDGSDSNQGGPIAPLIVMTTNVTQHSNYSVRFSPDAAGGSPPLAQYAPQLLSPSAVQQSAGSVIDVLNSTTTTTTTTVDGTDYLDDNQTELIYPAIPGLSSSSSSSSGSSGGSSSYASRRTGGGDGQQVQMTTTSTTTNSATAETRKTPEQHCVVMGVPYKVGAVLKQETGNCLHCVCVQGPDSDPVPRVTCTPLNCPPLILPDVLDGAGF
nr:uncharacterized protein LOC109397311 [Aedes albopictus]XP_029725745.1 uncharacterized protein LOC109397311 [Aedes albopictus]